MIAAHAVARRNVAAAFPLIAVAGDRAALGFLEYFDINIRNRNIRAVDSGQYAHPFNGWFALLSANPRYD
jgi:hypothetical protein